MKIGIIGPTRIDKFCDSLDVEKSEYVHFLNKVAEHLAKKGHEIIIMPAEDTAQGVVAQTYKDFRGKKVIGLMPHDDVEFGLMNLDETIADDIINCGTWRNQPETLCELSDVLLVVGWAPGGMIEICYTKWFKVKKVFVFEDFLSQKIHPELTKDLTLEYVNIHNWEEKLK